MNVGTFWDHIGGLDPVHCDAVRRASADAIDRVPGIDAVMGLFSQDTGIAGYPDRGWMQARRTDLHDAGNDVGTVNCMELPEFVAAIKALRAVSATAPSKAIISAENRSPVTSLKRAAKLLGRPNEDSGVKWLKNCIEDGTILAEQTSRQGYVFDKTQFPANSWPEATPAKSR